MKEKIGLLQKFIWWCKGVCMYCGGVIMEKGDYI